MFYLGIPVKDSQELTQECLESIKETVVDPEQLRVIIFDNGSSERYTFEDFGNPDFGPEATDGMPYAIRRSEKNRGYYQPIVDLYEMATDADIVGLMHNDLFIYEKNWDRRLREAFVTHGQLGMVGFCGSNEVDDRGGRGGGTMVNFRGEKGATTESTGRRVTGLEPAVVFDSLFMAMKRHLVPLLGVDENFQLCHFGDRVWPLRLIEHGWYCAVLGIEIDHMGGQTAVKNKTIEDDDREWCKRQGLEIPEGQTAGQTQYLEAERRYLAEFRDQKKMVPGRVMPSYTFVRTVHA